MESTYNADIMHLLVIENGKLIVQKIVSDVLFETFPVDDVENISDYENLHISNDADWMIKMFSNVL